MRGKFIVFEGVDGVGKSTLIEKVKQEFPNTLKIRGFNHDSTWNKFINSNPSSVFYYFNFALQTEQIRSAIRKGKTVLQDRYVQTVDTYAPDNARLHNKLTRKLFSPLFLEPDFYVYVSANIESIIDRLRGDDQEFHQKLIQNPNRILERQEAYQEIYNNITSPKYQIDTTNRFPKDTGLELITTLRRQKIC